MALSNYLNKITKVKKSTIEYIFSLDHTRRKRDSQPENTPPNAGKETMRVHICSKACTDIAINTNARPSAISM